MTDATETDEIERIEAGARLSAAMDLLRDKGIPVDAAAAITAVAMVTLSCFFAA